MTQNSVFSSFGQCSCCDPEPNEGDFGNGCPRSCGGFSGKTCGNATTAHTIDYTSRVDYDMELLTPFGDKVIKTDFYRESNWAFSGQ